MEVSIQMVYVAGMSPIVSKEMGKHVLGLRYHRLPQW